MLRVHSCVIVLSPLLIVSTGCSNKVQTATDLNMSRMDESKQAYGEHLTHMVDNAILRDMSVADVHFIRHTSELSGVGEARLNRMAKLLQTYGGTVRYNTEEQNEELVEQRMAHVREYLELTGCDMDRVEIAVMMPGGRGMPAHESIRKYQKGTAKDSSAAAGSATFVPAMTQSAGG